MIDHPAAIAEVETVASYLRQLNTVLAVQGGRIKGEVTEVKPYERAIYFTIKDADEAALLNCIIWPSVYAVNGIELHEGDEVIITGRPDIYAPTGRLSFKTETIEYAGEGALKRAYDKLKARLDSEGLLALERKRPLPELPTKIGIITSMSGVVIQDFTTNLNRRGYKLVAIDSRVEGKDAIHDLLAAIKTMAKQDIEALVIIRGGGSWESLQAFNTESVVRAIANFKVPVIAGIGHDVDVTLSEMVADIPRSTPTAVAEALNEPWDGLEGSLQWLERRTVGSFQSWLAAAPSIINEHSNDVFRGCEQQLAERRQELNRHSSRVSAAFAALARRVRQAHGSLRTTAGIMKSALTAKNQYLAQVGPRMNQRLFAGLVQSAKSIASLERTIASYDPKQNMRRGYSLSYVNGRLLRSINGVTKGQALLTQLADGEFTSEVKQVK